MPRALGLTLLLAVAPSARAQPGTGTPYGSRDARKCKVAAPRGAPSPAQAAQGFVCTNEHEDGRHIWLVENVRVQVGRGRPFQYRTDAMAEIDPGAMVYPIRGSFANYMCSPRASVL